MSELTARRWDKGSGLPSSHKPREALEVALHRFDSGEWPADHIIVVFGHIDAEGGGIASFTQAGDFNVYAQLGLLRSAQGLILEENG